MQAAFARGAGHGLLQLGASEVGTTLPAVFSYWREFAARYVTALCTHRTIAKTFWGRAWCENLVSYSDYDNRLPRGRTYVRNGSVVDLQIAQGQITEMVSGSEIYEVKVAILPVAESC